MNAKQHNKEELINWCRRHRLCYSITSTASSDELKVAGRKFFLCDGQRFTGREFQLLKELKENATAAVRAGKVPARAPRVQYFAINRRKFKADAGTVTAQEIDLRAAYPTAAVRLKIITESTFEKLNAEPKEFRTKLIGALAARRETVHFDHLGREQGRTFTVNPITRHCWHLICAQVGEDMTRAARLDSGFLAFWVDNYFSTTDAAAVGENISDWYELKPHAPVQIKFANNAGNFIQWTLSDKRQFTFPLGEKIGAFYRLKKPVDNK